MAKVAFQVDRKKLETSIQRAEENGPLKNYDELWTKAVAFYNAMNPPREITKGVVCLRVKEWSIPTKTKPGARGRAAGGVLSDEQKAAMQAGRKPGGRANRLKNDPIIQDGFRKIKENTPIRFESLVTKLTEHGSKVQAWL